ncbi:MAG: hydrogenase nickel incorporation protein HypB [Spongiibacteraceae bacterium]
MCITCGCSDGANIRIDGKPLTELSALAELTFSPLASATPTPQHHHDTPTAAQSPSQLDTHSEPANVHALEERILAKNDQLAAANRQWLQERKILGLNLLSSPGAGKTTLLEHSIKDLQQQISCSVIEGDQATENDALRIRAAGAKAVQINTGTGCHLEANMLADGLTQLKPEDNSLLFIENVGNLVCPALFDLGEQRRVVILSITEGEDKPIKYPYIFHDADLVLLNKIDLLPHLNFDLARCIDNVRAVNPKVEIMTISASSGEGLDGWYQWIENNRP